MAGLALLLRLPVVIAIHIEPDRVILASDSRHYLALANNLIEHGVFSRGQAPPFTPENYRTPGYPILLTPFIFIFGQLPLRMIVIGQMLLGSVTAAGVVILGKRLFNQRVGLVAGLYYALAPMPIIMVGYAYAETLFSALLVGGAILLITAIDRSRFGLAVLSGLIFGYAALVRPIALLLLPVLFLIPLIRLPLRRGWQYSLALTLAFMLPAGGWMARNAALFEHFSIASVSDNNLYNYSVTSTEARRLNITREESIERLALRLKELPPDDSGWDYAREGEVATQVILEHPIAFAWYNGVDALNGFRPGFSFMLFLWDEDKRAPVDTFASGDFGATFASMSGQAIPILIIEGYMIILLVLLGFFSISGLINLVVQQRWSEFVLLVMIPAVLLYLPGIASNGRFRTPTETLLAILVGVGFWWFYDRFTQTDSAEDSAS